MVLNRVTHLIKPAYRFSYCFNILDWGLEVANLAVNKDVEVREYDTG